MPNDALQATPRASFNHKGVIEEESTRPYKTRAFALIGQLDDQHSQSGMNGYCLDALNELPAGGMVADAMAANPQWRSWPRAIRLERGVSLQEVRERERIAENLINEILAEEGVKQ